LAAMRVVKDAFDPQGLLNPGKLLPDGMPPGSTAPGDRPAHATPRGFSLRPRPSVWS